MKYLDLTLSTPAENLACDEALLDFCEERAVRKFFGCGNPLDILWWLVTPIKSIVK